MPVQPPYQEDRLQHLEEKFDKFSEKFDTLSNKFAEITIWATIGKMSIGGLLGGVATLAVTILIKYLPK